eukprot:g19818.t1
MIALRKFLPSCESHTCAAQIFVFQSYILHVEQDDLVNQLTAEFLRNCWYSTRCVSLSQCCWDLRPHLYACKASL